MNIWGNNFRVSIFGESHGAGIGVVIDGIPSGFEPDMAEISVQMQRRAPGRNLLSTPRKEADEVQILSGLYEGKTTGTPLCGIIMNSNTRSQDYTPELMRPGHADYTAIKKYGLSRDFRGGGHFSGRITAPLVFAGAIARQVLSKMGITVGSHILSIGGICDEKFDAVNLSADTLAALAKKDFPVCNEEVGEKMRSLIDEKRLDKNSVGGVIECAVCGVAAGVG